MPWDVSRFCSSFEEWEISIFYMYYVGVDAVVYSYIY